MNVVDHALFVFFAIAVPWLGNKGARQLAALSLEEFTSSMRRRQYVSVMMGQGLVVLAILVLWLASSRSFETLFIVHDLDRGFLQAGLVAILVASYFMLRIRRARHDPAVGARTVRDAGPVGGLLPRNEGDLGLFRVLSIFVGFSEELIYRGFLIWYVLGWVRVLSPEDVTPLGAAVAIAFSALVFGVAHAYQPGRGIVRVVALGALFGALVLGGGSLWLAVALHGLIDLCQGQIAFEHLRAVEGGGEGREREASAEREATGPSVRD